MSLIFGESVMIEQKLFLENITREGVLVKSRIDYILVSRTIDVHVRNIFYVETTMSDHSMVTVYFNTDVSERGPGMWIHNNLLLCEDSYRKKIIELIDKEKECNLYHTSVLVWWDNLKYKIKKIIPKL